MARSRRISFSSPLHWVGRLARRPALPHHSPRLRDRAPGARVEPPMIVDSHHHFWDPARADYPWMREEQAPIRRRFGPEDLRPLLSETGVDATILVQTRASLQETREFLAVAAGTPFVAGVVGWADLAGGGVAGTLEALRAAPGGEKLVGIRHQVHDEEDAGWLLRAEVERGLAA